MDFIEGLPLSNRHDTILVVVYCLTRMALFIPTFCDIDAEDLACIFLSQVFAKHGTLTDIVSNWQALHLLLLKITLSVARDQANLFMAYTLRPMVKLSRSTKSWNSIFQVYINYQKDDWVNSFPWLSLHITTLHTLQPWSPLSLLTRVFIPNLKCPLNLLCRTLLTKLLQISRNYICIS